MLAAFLEILEASEEGIPYRASVFGVDGGTRGEEWTRGGVIDNSILLLGDPSPSMEEDFCLFEGVTNDMPKALPEGIRIVLWSSRG